MRDMERLIARIDALKKEKPRVIVAIDGPCASGKTTLAARLGAYYDAPVLHMDDFFLQPHQRTRERFAQPGGNVDAERFLSEVLLPLSRGEGFLYRRYDCAAQVLLPGKHMEPGRLTIVEGSYSLHPMLEAHYDLRVLLTVDSDAQSARILARDGEKKHARFVSEWIPLENRYFEATDIELRCDMKLAMEEVS